MRREISPARMAWRNTYRLLRIARRESLKAAVDLLVTGQSCVVIGPDGEAKRIGPQDIRLFCADGAFAGVIKK